MNVDSSSVLAELPGLCLNRRAPHSWVSEATSDSSSNGFSCGGEFTGSSSFFDRSVFQVVLLVKQRLGSGRTSFQRRRGKGCS